MHRFYLPPGAWNDAPPVLDERQSHHAVDVLRLGVGARVTVFDGCGNEAPARLLSAGRGGVTVAPGPVTASPELPCRLTLAQAVPKGRTMDLIVQKAVELGASCILPVLSERTVVRMDRREAARKALRWRETAIEACKQCGRNHLPEIAEPRAPSEFFSSLPAHEMLLVASLQPDARPMKEVLAAALEERGRKPGSVLILVGPEGDLTPAEVAMAKSNGCLPVSLGPIILRSETAAMYCLSVLGHELFT
jgi:16S rRNA (uracil1498-N3)-methyltransferase